jgi:hypothetical protein
VKHSVEQQSTNPINSPNTTLTTGPTPWNDSMENVPPPSSIGSGSSL